MDTVLRRALGAVEASNGAEVRELRDGRIHRWLE